MEKTSINIKKTTHLHTVIIIFGMPEKAFQLYDKFYQNVKLKHIKRKLTRDLSVTSVTESLNEIIEILYQEGFARLL